MLKFAANLSMLFTEVPFLQRFRRAAEAGFDGVEYLFPYDYDAGEIAAQLSRYDLEQVLFNMPPGDWLAGDRGLAALPERCAEFRAGVATALDYAHRLGCRRIHAMAGVVADNADRNLAKNTYVANIRFAADAAAGYGITVLIEAINDRDMPGYFLTRLGEAEALLQKVDRPNVAIQLDYYHAQIMDGDLIKWTERLTGSFAHVQIASVPGRHEPNDGEIVYSSIFSTLEKLGYAGWIGCEYNPRDTTESGLGWLRSYETASTKKGN